MVIPYFISNIYILILSGIVLVVLPYFIRKWGTYTNKYKNKNKDFSPVSYQEKHITNHWTWPEKLCGFAKGPCSLERHAAGRLAQNVR
jgi:preprotein translocase subunit Sec63